MGKPKKKLQVPRKNAKRNKLKPEQRQKQKFLSSEPLKKKNSNLLQQPIALTNSTQTYRKKRKSKSKPSELFLKIRKTLFWPSSETLFPLLLLILKKEENLSPLLNKPFLSTFYNLKGKNNE